MQALNTGGALLTKVPGKGDLSLKMNSDASPNYSYNFHCHNGYEEQTTFTLGYYIFDPTAASGEHLEYLPSSKTTLVYPGTSKTDLAFAQGIAKHHNIDTILAFGCKSGAMVDTKEFGSPVPQTDSVWVCGAGCELANGEYHLDGEFKGKPMFTSSDSGLQLWFNDGEWRIGRSCDYYYVSSDEQPTGVWQVATFRANEATKSPAPSIYKGSVTVFGAGCELANGEYHLDGEFKGKPMFTSSDSGLQLWFNDGEWRIGRSCDYYYVSSDEQPTGVWQVATFRANEATKSPAPSVAP